MDDYVIIQKDTLTAMGDAVREATGESKLYTLEEMRKKLCPELLHTIVRSDVMISFSLPNDITSIRYEAFRDYGGFTEITIPNSVSSVEDRAFMGCRNLKTVTFKGTPSKIGQYSFNSLSLTTINVPWAEGEVANAPWGATNAMINYGIRGE